MERLMSGKWAFIDSSRKTLMSIQVAIRALRPISLLTRISALPLILATTLCGQGLALAGAANQILPGAQTAPTVAVSAGQTPGYSQFALGQGEYIYKIGDRRKYLLHVPATYDATRMTPLVLFFHGGGGHMEQAAKDYGWREKAEKEGFVVAFPNGSSVLPRQHLATWNAGACCGYARDKGIDDVGFVRQVIADIERQVHIDPGKIFAVGMSNGGMLVYRLACEMADTFKAVASVAGTDNTTACSPARPISILHIHARDDDHVLFEGGAGEGAFRDETKITDFTSVPATIDRWVARDHADQTPRRVLSVPGAYGDLYTSTQNQARIELVVTESGGHSWPGGKSVRGKKPSRAIDADDIIWDFFMKQVR